MLYEKLCSLFFALSSVRVCPLEANKASVEQVNHIVSSLDNRVDPCVDFYSYACNNWEEHHKNMGYKEITGQVENKVNVLMSNVMRTLHHHQQLMAESFVQKTRNYYFSCIKEKNNNVRRYFETVKPSDTLEWPLLEHVGLYEKYGENIYPNEWPSQEWNALEMLGHLQSFGLDNVLINQEIERHKNNSLKIFFLQPYVMEEDILIQEMIMVLLQRLGLPEEMASQYAQTIMETQDKWHEIYDNFAPYNVANNVISLTYSQLSQQYPQLSKFLDKLTRIQKDDEIILNNFEYFKFLANREWSPEEQRNLCNYLMIKFAIYLLKDSTSEFTHLDCTIDLRRKMNLALNYLYYTNIHILKGTEINIDLDCMFRDVRKYFLEILEENHLNLHENQLQQLKAKLYYLTPNLGNLPSNVNLNHIEEFYKDIPPLDRNNYYYNHLELLKHRFRKSLSYLQNETFYIAMDNDVGSSSGPSYSPKQNMAIVNLGFLQTPIYDYSYHPILKWSILGFLIGHEFAHSIDPAGLMFDPHGESTLESASILQNSNFTSALDCMQQQEPTDAINERIADLVGSHVAYKAYVRSPQTNLQPSDSITKIPWKKLFFLNMAQYFCGRKDAEFLDHDQDAIRLREIVKNSEGFAKAFRCPHGTPMNPWPKCRLY